MSIVAPSACAAPVALLQLHCSSCTGAAARAQLGARSVGRLISEFLPYPGTVLGPPVPTAGQKSPSATGSGPARGKPRTCRARCRPGPEPALLGTRELLPHRLLPPGFPPPE